MATFKVGPIHGDTLAPLIALTRGSQEVPEMVLDSLIVARLSYTIEVDTLAPLLESCGRSLISNVTNEPVRLA